MCTIDGFFFPCWGVTILLQKLQQHTKWTVRSNQFIPRNFLQDNDNVTRKTRSVWERHGNALSYWGRIAGKDDIRKLSAVFKTLGKHAPWCGKLSITYESFRNGFCGFCYNIYEEKEKKWKNLPLSIDLNLNDVLYCRTSQSRYWIFLIFTCQSLLSCSIKLF